MLLCILTAHAKMQQYCYTFLSNEFMCFALALLFQRIQAQIVFKPTLSSSAYGLY